MALPSMTIAFWLLVLLCAASAGWGGYQYRRRRRETVELGQSLAAARKEIQERDADHARNKAHWEQTEEKLRSYLQLMDTLINTIPNPIYFKDADGIFQGCNRVFAKSILGLTRDRIIGRRPQDLTDQMPADLAAVYQREERRMIEKAGFHTYEAAVQCADGQRRDYLFNLAPVLDGGGKLSGSVAVLSDLTEKNRAARDRADREKLEGVLEIAGAVCHELNQPLQTVSGYIELMALTIEAGEARAFVDKLEVQVARMRDITDKLHGITRYETTDYAGETKIIDIHRASDTT